MLTTLKATDSCVLPHGGEKGINNMIRVMLVDDHDLVRTGVRRLLEDSPLIKVIAEASDGEQAYRMVKENRPDVVLMDLQMPGVGGLEATRKILQYDDGIRVIILTVHAEEPFPTKLLKTGASGYLTKGCSPDEMVNAIKRVHTGKKYLGNEIAQQLALTVMPGGEKSPLDILSERELQVMLMVTQGEKIQKIADKLHLSPKTVSTYRYRIFEKLAVKSDVELTHFAIRHGLMDDPGLDID
jgi:two-component system invasion response regulator UvrY